MDEIRTTLKRGDIILSAKLVRELGKGMVDKLREERVDKSDEEE